MPKWCAVTPWGCIQTDEIGTKHATPPSRGRSGTGSCILFLYCGIVRPVPFPSRRCLAEF